MAQHRRLLFIFVLSFYSLISFSQDLTGIWKGYFIADDGSHYRLEFQVKQNSKGEVAVSGVSYSWQDDIKFYGKATMTGSFIKSSQNFRIKEIKTVEVKSATGFGTCIMNYDLVYSRSGKEEFLDGTYLGKQEVKIGPNPYQWGDCGGGKVSLRRVQTSDFYIEPFLRKKNTPVSRPPVDTSVAKKTAPPVVKKNTVVKNTTQRNTVSRPPASRTNQPVTRTTTPVRPTTDSALMRNMTEPIAKNTIKPTTNTSAVLRDRSNELMKSLVVDDPDVTVRLYDNGEIDDDTISIYYDKRLVLANQRLSTTPITVKLKLDDENEVHELVMVAENLGRIPPNTALMIVDAGDRRFDVRITSTEQKNALVRFSYQKPK